MHGQHVLPFFSTKKNPAPSSIEDSLISPADSKLFMYLSIVCFSEHDRLYGGWWGERHQWWEVSSTVMLLRAETGVLRKGRRGVKTVPAEHTPGSDSRCTPVNLRTRNPWSGFFSWWPPAAPDAWSSLGTIDKRCSCSEKNAMWRQALSGC